MAERPYTILSCCMSLDGYLDDGSQQRLVLSNAADLDRVDALRARCDAILVGAATVRNDNPALSIHSGVRRADRIRRGMSPDPVKVTVTAGGKLDPEARVFTAGDTGATSRSDSRLVYCAAPAFEGARAALGELACVVDAGEPVRMSWLTADLAVRGVGRLLVEGGGTILTQFLTEQVADELQLAVAPIFVGDPAGTRFVEAGDFPWRCGRRARLAGSRTIGDVVVLRYALSERFDPDLEEAP